MDKAKREELYLKTVSGNDVPVRDVRLRADQLRALLADSAWRERAEEQIRQVRAVADHLQEARDAGAIQRDDGWEPDAVIARLHAIVDDQREEPS